MLVTNDLNPDPRVAREAKTLQERGYDIRVVGLGENGTRNFKANASGLTTLLIRATPLAHSARGIGWIRAMWRILMFYAGCIRKLGVLLEDVAIIHAHDFDTLPIALFMSRLSGARVV